MSTGALLILLGLASMALPRDARAIQYLGPVYVESTTCPYNLVWVDTANDPDPGHHHCAIPVLIYDDGRGTPDSGPQNDPPAPAPFEQENLSAKLNCAIKNYSPYQKKGKINHTKVWVYDAEFSLEQVWSRTARTDLDPALWQNVDGQTWYSTKSTKSTMFEAAFHSYPLNWPITNPDGSKGVFVGPLSAFEVSLFTAAHEIAHQNGVAVAPGSDDHLANYYGKLAVERYRSDNGAKCND